MKVQIPDALKQDVPQNLFGRILAATPVVMAVVATMLAGLASSEMTRAQYDRSMAAQQQSKAGDQWSFFQAKRLRASLQRNTVDLLQATAELHPLDAAAFADTDTQVVQCLVKGTAPPVPAGGELAAELKAAIEGIEKLEPDPAVNALVAKVSAPALEDAMKAARERVQAFDALTGPITKAIEALEKKGANRDFIAARLRYTAARYDAEARLNQTIANLYEVQVRKYNLSAVRHHHRSQQFFFGMLAAQAGVIIATFAMAARKRNLLWSIAAGAGLLAVIFAVYVYLYV